jgi:hypothetical protein
MLHVDPEGWFAISGSKQLVECWTSIPIKFDDKPDWQKRRLMPRLRVAIGELDIGARQSVAAVFSSDDSADRDAENAVLTNPGASTFVATPDSFRFERSFARPEPPVPLRRLPAYGPYNYSYRFSPTSPDATLAHWHAADVLAEWPPVPVERWTWGNARGPWLSMVPAAGVVQRRTSRRDDGYFGLQLSLAIPAGSGAQLITNWSG